jgi:hypothetical protein
MRKFVYAIAGVLALGPLAVIAPAGAAVAHPAAPQILCDGYPEVTIANQNSTGGYVGTMHLASGVITDSYSKTPVDFCLVQIVQYHEFAFREYGTPDCATYQASTNIVLMENCDYATNTSQQWDDTTGQDAGFVYPESDNAQVLDGSGGDTDVFMNTPLASPDNQYWAFSCVVKMNCTPSSL